ncbi:transglutaminase domain-containing protein [Deinococcus cavernae]|uniref:Transglutaminase domain-containing protein n=1 Tax=Deinococcus cavernae TaxID=2320857 RepID=A0A418V7X0_9DEIO|nr:transglutaminase-like domain-containing protein [Deinococcus cavernae]RJF72202.1 transglutaminase domain-containing protein [Deinococcus cavernae]
MTVHYDRHTPFSHPGQFSAALRDLPADPRELSVCVRGLISHYRVTPNIPAEREKDRQARWVSELLKVIQSRNAAPLCQVRALNERFVGCCRDYALLTVAALRGHGVPARIRVGWAPYLNPDFTHDHVIAEWQGGHRWVQGDPELDPRKYRFDTMDMPPGTFRTAGETWLAFRAGKLDAARYGMAPGLYGGPQMLRDYVLRELAALSGHELLLWDNWGLMEVPFEQMTPQQITLLDAVAVALTTQNPARWLELSRHSELRVPRHVKTFDFQEAYLPTDLNRTHSL